jgi:hypothetical protein
MPGSCECGNETSGSIKCGEFLDQLMTYEMVKNPAPCSYIVICVHTKHKAGTVGIMAPASCRLALNFRKTQH